MKKNSGNKIGLGMFVSVGLFLFITAIYYIGKKQQLFNDTFRVSGIFKDVRGLQVGNNVRFAGINVGIIDDIAIITDTTVKVDMLIDEATRKFIRKNAHAIIGSDGLMGNKILIIIPGATGGKPIENNDFIATNVPVNIDDILMKLKITGDNAATITGDLSAIMGNIRSGKGTVGKLFMDSGFAENLDRTVVNLKQGTGGFSKNMEAAKHSFLLRAFFKDRKKKGENKNVNKKLIIKEEKKPTRKERREARRKAREEKKQQ